MTQESYRQSLSVVITVIIIDGPNAYVDKNNIGSGYILPRNDNLFCIKKKI